MGRRKEIWQMDKPQWAHDCKQCKFLGCVLKEIDGKYQYVDLYYCGPRRYEGSVVVRFGNDGPDYFSMPLGLAIRHAMKDHAYQRAVARGVRSGVIKPHKLAAAIRLWDSF